MFRKWTRRVTPPVKSRHRRRRHGVSLLDSGCLIGAGIHLARHKDQRGTAEVSRVLLMYWLALAMGLGSIFGAAFHVFDAKETADDRLRALEPDRDRRLPVRKRDGRPAIGVAGMLALWIRDAVRLAVIVIATISSG